MAKRKFDKKQATNKRTVQNVIYEWLSQYHKRDNDKAITIGMFPGCVPQKSLLMYNKYFTVKGTTKIPTQLPIIYAYEKDTYTYNYLRSINSLATKEKQGNVRLKHQNINDISESHSFEDLDFCTTLFSDRKRVFPTIQSEDSFSVIRNRLALMITDTTSHSRKSLSFTVTLRNGLGKQSTIKCLQSLVYSLGHKIDYIDHICPSSSRCYGKGFLVEGAGQQHSNGCIYHAFEHLVELSSLNNYDPYAKKSVAARMFTYTDGSPMLVFVMTFK